MSSIIKTEIGKGDVKIPFFKISFFPCGKFSNSKKITGKYRVAGVGDQLKTGDTVLMLWKPARIERNKNGQTLKITCRTD